MATTWKGREEEGMILRKLGGYITWKGREEEGVTSCKLGG